MDDVYGGGSVIGFSKVPCTPVTGAFANYFDVFGDVDHQRIGTGSSTTSSTSSCGGADGDELPMLLDKNSRILKISSASSLLSTSSYLCKSCNKRLASTKTSRSNRSINSRDSFEVTSAIQRDPYIVFLQEKQVEILGALHQEIRMLKHENAELKFQIHVILQQQDSSEEPERLCSYQDKVTSPTGNNKRESNAMIMAVCGDREKMLELELESATKMIQELKWVQQHYENKIRMQETKMEDLMQQLNISSSNNDTVKIWPIQYQASLPVNQSTKATNTTSRPLKSGRQRSSSVHQHPETINRRNSLQSILPDDYKEQVATLPPILIKQLANPSNSIRTSNTLFNSTTGANGKQHENNVNSKVNRRSSMNHANAPATLVRTNNNTPAAFCGDESSHYDN